MNLDELAQIGLNAPWTAGLETLGTAGQLGFERGKKAATDAIIAAILRDGGAQRRLDET